MLGTAFATNVAGYTILGGDGWRFAFRVVALVAMLIGWATLTFAVDPNHVEQPPGSMRRSEKKAGLSDTLTEFAQVRNP